jgi:hypothetical protein
MQIAESKLINFHIGTYNDKNTTSWHGTVKPFFSLIKRYENIKNKQR